MLSPWVLHALVGMVRNIRNRLSHTGIQQFSIYSKAHNSLDLFPELLCPTPALSVAKLAFGKWHERLGTLGKSKDWLLDLQRLAIPHLAEKPLHVVFPLSPESTERTTHAL